MATIKKRKVYFYTARATQGVDFEAVLLSDAFRNGMLTFGSKEVEMKFVLKDESTGYVRGVVSTTRTSGIPPKHRPGTNVYDGIPLEPQEGVAYGSAFLYDPSLGVLAYEFNKFGATLSEFEEFIKVKVGNGMAGFPEFFPTLDLIYGVDAYRRLEGLAAATRFSIKVASPRSILTEARMAQSSISDGLRSAQEQAQGVIGNMADMATALNARDSMEVVFSCSPVHEGGLSKGVLGSISNRLRALGGSISLIKSIKVEGRVVDITGRLKKAEPINLLHDVLYKQFDLEEPARHVDIQPTARKEGILSSYRDALPNIQQIL
ncbi:MAG: hypothetical protein U0176_17750 [Bacteroidia bacterium]